MKLGNGLFILLVIAVAVAYVVGWPSPEFWFWITH